MGGVILEKEMKYSTPQKYGGGREVSKNEKNKHSDGVFIVGAS